MKNKNSLIILICTFITVIAGASILYNLLSNKLSVNQLSVEQTKQPPKPTQPPKATDFTVTDVNGTPVSLSDFAGKPVILNFWASWCGPCKSEMPDFNDAYNEYKDKIVFMMVNLTDGVQETVESASSYIKDAGYSFDIYFDTETDAAMAYNVYSVPTTYFINSDGNIVTYAKGAINYQTLKKGIDMIYSDNGQ